MTKRCLEAAAVTNAGEMRPIHRICLRSTALARRQKPAIIQCRTSSHANLRSARLRFYDRILAYTGGLRRHGSCSSNLSCRTSQLLAPISAQALCARLTATNGAASINTSLQRRMRDFLHRDRHASSLSSVENVLLAS
jgi:hypothetical protein